MSAYAATAGCPEARVAVEPRLQAAREKLALSERTRERVARELEALKRSGQADPRMLQDYTTYLQRVQDLVDENRRIVRKLEALCAPGADLTASSAAQGRSVSSGPVSPDEETDELAALDRKLQDSLASFDEMLLKRINAIQAESADKMRDLAQQAAQAAGRARQYGSAATSPSASREGGQQGAEGSQGQEGAQSQEGAQGQAGSQGGGQGENTAGGGQTGTETATTGMGQASGPGTQASGRRGKGQAASPTRGQTGSGAAASRTYNPDDDDIVARQLREAAEQETDPELKKKLWKEYEAYKKNTRP